MQNASTSGTVTTDINISDYLPLQNHMRIQ